MRDTLAVILKFVVTLLLIPLVIASVISFTRALQLLPAGRWENFCAGMLLYVLLHLFVFEFRGMYQFGQKVVADLCGFFAPLVKVAPFVLPIYSIVLLVLHYLVKFFYHTESLTQIFMFLVGFTLAMHFICTAAKLREGDGNAAKLNYVFALCLILVLDIFLLSLLFGLTVKGFSFVDFFRSLAGHSGEIYRTVFKQLFGR